MISSYDRTGYDKLNAPQKVASSFSTKQERQGVKKTLLLTQEDERKIGILKAAGSQLLFEKEGGSKGLVEEMEDAELIYQEKLLEDNMQLVAKLVASTATYDYEKERLTAQGGTLTRYRLAGHQLPDISDLKEPYFLGSAKEFDVDFRENILKAHQLIGTSFAAQEAHFQNGEFRIAGGFTYEHPLGILQAKSAKGRFEELKGPPKEIMLEEETIVQLKDGSRILSPFSRLETGSWTAFFHGLEGNKVVLERPSQSLYLKSLEMTVKFFPPTVKAAAWIDHLKAEGGVEIGLPSDLKLQGRHALFHTFTPEGKFSKALLTEDCLLTKGNEAEIYAEEIAADFDEDRVTLKVAQGTLQDIKFDAALVQITQGEKTLDLLYIEGPSTLKMKDDSGLEHTLKTYGTILVDPKAKRASIASDDKQIHFSNGWGDIYADYMQVYFGEFDGKLKPLKLNLEGNIRLQNVHAGLERYALSDHADYDLEKGELTLKATRPQRVLFYDLANKIQASAPALVLKRNPETQKDEIKGLGNVRFLLAEEEWNELKKRFSFE